MPEPHSQEEPQSAAVTQAKAELRSQFLERRRSLGGVELQASELISQRVLQRFGAGTDATVAGYVAIADEVDPAPVLQALAGKGIALALPIAEKAQEAMTFKAWRIEDPLVSGSYGTKIPGDAAQVVAPDVLLVPVVAFDTAGYRLGFGGGFYDRTISALRHNKIIAAYGIAYDGQEVAEVPRGPFDVRLDGLFTPTRSLEFFS